MKDTFDFKQEAEKTVKKIRDLLVYGSNNNIDKNHTNFRRGHLIRAAVPIAALKNALYGHIPTPSVFAKLNSLAIEKYGYAQCGEQAQSAFIDLVEKGIYPIYFCVTTHGEHNLLVIGGTPFSNKNEIDIQNEHVFICDPWINKVYPLSEFESMKEDNSEGKYNPETYNGIIPPHYLSGALNIVYGVNNKEELLEFQQKITIHPDVLDMFSSKLTTEEAVKRDLDKLQQDYMMLSKTHLSSNPGAQAVLTEIKTILKFLRAEELKITADNRTKRKHLSLFNNKPVSKIISKTFQQIDVNTILENINSDNLIADAKLLNFALLHGDSDLVSKALALNIEPNEDTLNCALLSGHPSFINEIYHINARLNLDSLNCAQLNKYSEHWLKAKFQNTIKSDKSDTDICNEMIDKYFFPIKKQIEVAIVQPQF